MRNEKIPLSTSILTHVRNLPYFEIGNIPTLGASLHHTRIVLSRLCAQKRIIRLKKGMYVSQAYIDRIKIDKIYSVYLEFIATKMYEPSYLSLEYILYEHNALTDVPANLTLITTKKTYHTSNDLGTFVYHKIKNELFRNYRIKRNNHFIYGRASKAKALFDYLYLRRKQIADRKMLEEYRLNLEVFSQDDFVELEKYIHDTGSAKMNKIYTWVKEDD
jgi:predicted transcriptional regulator of viral defense system